MACANAMVALFRVALIAWQIDLGPAVLSPAATNRAEP